MTAPRFVASYPSPAELLAVHDNELARGGLLVHGATVERAVAGADCVVEIQVAGRTVGELPARIAAVIPGVGVAVMFTSGLEAIAALERRVREGGAAPEKAKEPALIGERLKAMSVAQKMQLALAASRDERFALLRDTNKALHLYVLRNPRIGLDEVQAAAKMPGLSAEAIKFITEHAEWAMNPVVCANLVRNPGTPMPIALRLLDRIPPNDVRALAKGGARQPLVQAARRKLNE